MEAGSLMSACTQAVFKYSGTQPEDRQVFIIGSSRGAGTSQTSLRNFGGIISTQLDERFSCATVLQSSSTETGRKEDQILWLGSGTSRKNQELLVWISSHSFDPSESLESEDVPHSMP